MQIFIPLDRIVVKCDTTSAIFKFKANPKRKKGTNKL